MPQIVFDVTFQTIEGKCIAQEEIYLGQNRPYYIRSMGIENGSYIRVAGSNSSVDETILKGLEYQGTGKLYDEIVSVETGYDEKQALNLCNDIWMHTGIENIEIDIEVVEDELLSVVSDTEKKVVSLILKNQEITKDKMTEMMGM